MAKFFVYPYNANSESSRMIATALDGKRIKLEGSAFRPGPGKHIINWGSSRCPYDTALNPAASLETFACKKRTFEAFDSKFFPPFATTPEGVARFFGQDGRSIVFARTTTRGNSGEGIVVCDDPLNIPRAPLYTKYIKKESEYRVHFVGSNIIKVQRKALKEGHENPNFMIRNVANGFVFVVNDVVLPASCEALCREFIELCNRAGLTFGAIDIIYNKRNDRGYILEVNTAPGLCESTARTYADAFKERLG